MSNDDTGEVIPVTGASSGIGALSVRAPARAGHAVYAGIRQIPARNATTVADPTRYGTETFPFGIDTAFVVPDAFTTGTDHLANAGAPADVDCAEAHAQRHAP